MLAVNTGSGTPGERTHGRDRQTSNKWLVLSLLGLDAELMLAVNIGSGCAWLTELWR